METAASASSLLNFLLISILFFRQRKQDQHTHNFIHQALTKLERVESNVREVQPHLQIIPNLQAQIDNFGKQLPTAEDHSHLHNSLARIERVESTLHNLPNQIQVQVNNLGEQLPTPQDWLNLHTAVTNIDTVTSTLQHLQTKVESSTQGLEEKICSLVTSVHHLKEAVNSTPVPPSLNKIAVFVDAANIEIAAKTKGWKFDYHKLERELTKSAAEVLGLFYYTALEADYQPKAKGIENYQVISKPIARYRDGNAKGNLDLEIACDLITKSSEFGTAILVSGDGDFTCVVKYLQEQHKQVKVVAFADSTKTELRMRADEFIDLNTIAEVFNRIPTAQSNSNSTSKLFTNLAAKPKHPTISKSVTNTTTKPKPILRASTSTYDLDK